MPREIININKFHGGLNNASDPKDLKSNEFANTAGFEFGKDGEIRFPGHAKMDKTIAPVLGAPTAGYGLKVFNTSYSFNQNASSGGVLSHSVTTEPYNGKKAWFSFNVASPPSSLSESFLTSGTANDSLLLQILIDGSTILATNTPANPSGGAGGDATNYGSGNFLLYDGIDGGNVGVTHPTDSSLGPNYYYYNHSYWGSGWSMNYGVAALVDDLVQCINAGSAAWTATAADIGTDGEFFGQINVEADNIGTAYNDALIIRVRFNDGDYFDSTHTQANQQWWSLSVLDEQGDSFGSIDSNLDFSGNITGGANAVAQVSKITVSGTPQTGEVYKAQITGGGQDINVTAATSAAGGSPTQETQRDALYTALIAAHSCIVASSNGATDEIILTKTNDSDGYHIVVTSEEAGESGQFTIATWIESPALNKYDAEVVGYVNDAGYLKLYSTELSSWNGNYYNMGWSSTACQALMHADNSFLRIVDTNFDNTGNPNFIWGPVNSPTLFLSSINNAKFIQENNTIKSPSLTTATDPSPSAGTHFVRRDCSAALSASNNKQLQLLIATEGSAGSGGWEGKWQFYVSAVYDGVIESLPSDPVHFHASSGLNYLDFGSSDDGGKKMRMHVQLDHGGTAAYAFPTRMTAMRVYASSELDGYGEKWHIGTVDFTDGFIRADGGASEAWVSISGNDYKIGSGPADLDFTNPPEIESFELINGYSHTNDNISARYKCIAKSGRRAFIGNVMYGSANTIYNDRIIVSPPNQMDVFPTPHNVIDVDVSDGDRIVQLETYDDYLLEFKVKNLYIINIAGGDPSSYYLESSRKFMGITSHNAVCKTKYGIFWVNRHGAYLFDGDPDNIVELNFYEEDDKKIARLNSDVWSDFGADSTSIMVGYDANSDNVIIKKSCEASVTSGHVFIYSFRTNSWSKSTSENSKGYFIDSKITSNFDNRENGDLITIAESSWALPTGDAGGDPR